MTEWDEIFLTDQMLATTLKLPRAKIAPSLLSGDFANLASECKRMLEYGADYLHMGTPFIGI
jgi:hypothetical protein